MVCRLLKEDGNHGSASLGGGRGGGGGGYGVGEDKNQED